MKINIAHRTNVRRQRRRGFTLTEIAIVLGIVGLILGAIWVAAAAVYNNLRISHANTEILQIAQSVRSLYATSSNDAGLTTDNLICSKAVPSDMVNVAGCTGAGTLLDPWANGATTVTADTDNAGFVIAMTNVPKSACINLLMAVSGPGRDPGLFYAEGSAAAPPAMATAAAFTPAQVASPTAANAAPVGGFNFGGCQTGDPETVAFGFSLK